jgi:hypothetical protein
LLKEKSNGLERPAIVGDSPVGVVLSVILE